MTAPKNAIYKWMKTATPDQKKALAKAAGTSVGQLKQLQSGNRGASAALAQRLAAASKTLHIRALYLDQRDLCDACGKCPLIDQKPKPKPKKKAKAA
jgi:transcriptional regulator with XRE-family HTH domain